MEAKSVEESWLERTVRDSRARSCARERTGKEGEGEVKGEESR